MRIEENRVFVFTFDTGEMGNISIPVRGESRESAAASLQGMFGRMQAELAMQFPRVLAGTEPAIDQANTIVPDSTGLTGVLVERIDTLLAGLGAAGLTEDARAKTIKNWTELDFAPENYAQIVRELELIASGAKVVPVKGKKK